MNVLIYANYTKAQQIHVTSIIINLTKINITPRKIPLHVHVVCNSTVNSQTGL